MARPQFEPFELEQFMSENEQKVEFVFAESGVHPMKLGELLGSEDCKAELMETLLNYPEVNGEAKLRAKIAALYGEHDADKVLVTVGASEANFILAECLLAPGDHVAVLEPTYRQFWGVARNAGGVVRAFQLDEERGWALDLASLEAAVTADTKVVAVVHPSNPTGKVLSSAELQAIVDAARRVGAWLVADEVYAGAERDTDEETPSIYRFGYEKCIAIGSLSKAYGLPGLRMGWIVGPAEIVARAWRSHEYIAISSSMLGNRLAAHALDPEVRKRIFARSRRLIRAGWPIMEQAVAEHADMLSVVAPGASAMCFLRYNLAIPSMELVRRLIREKSILVVPGIVFGKEHHLRFSFALPEPVVREGVKRLVEVLLAVKEEEAAAGAASS